jgi:Holliday junction resolvase|tara:strand:+ start:262 stop:516 length:255 start_codon:yes stop_codon:yes gene_type:complete
MELKVAKSNKVLISANQVAWHIGFNRCGGQSFILVKRSKDRCVFLFEGSSATEIRDSGLATPCIWSGQDLAALFSFLKERDRRT